MLFVGVGWFWGLTSEFWAVFEEESCKCLDLEEKVEGGEGGDDLLGFEGDGDDLADEAEDIVGSSSRLGSLTMPERGSVETRYWSITHSRAERLPRR